MEIKIPARIPGVEYLCTLPDDYDAESLHLLVCDDKHLVVTCWDQPPLWINRDAGEVSEIKPQERGELEAQFIFL